MKDKIAHVLSVPKSQMMPKWVIFFDTETVEERITDKKKRLILKLGYAELTRRNQHGVLECVDSCVFRSREEFNLWFSRVAVGRERYYLVAHNVSFDIRVLELFDFLAETGWDRTLFIDESINFISRWRKDNTTLLVMNNQQLFNTSLKKLGESIGEYKSSVNFALASESELLEYCKQDVRVMISAWNAWLKFLAENKLGSFKITAASQAMSSYRHRFMQHPIFIHNDKRAIALERESYHGGRVECFRIGEVNEGKIYCLDINSMYPYVMKTNAVPVKLLKYYASIPTATFNSVKQKYGYIVEAEIEADKPVLPVVYEGRLCFPTGRFRGVFTKPEIERAGSAARVQKVFRCALYEEAVAFEGFTDFFYNARLRFKDEGNIAFAYISKILMNACYGKFAQHNFEYRRIGKSRTLPDGYYNVDWFGNQTKVKLRVLNGIVEMAKGEQEGFNSFVAIASYITANARAYLYEMIQLAGDHNVYYCDTDSLFTTEEGWQRLQQFIEPSQLGMLKVVRIEDTAAFFAPKAYRFGKDFTRKGIRSDAHMVSETSFEQDKFVGFRGALRANDLHGVIVERVVKRLSLRYTKGAVTEHGRVVPFHLDLASPLPPPVLPKQRK